MHTLVVGAADEHAAEELRGVTDSALRALATLLRVCFIAPKLMPGLWHHSCSCKQLL